MKHIHIHGSELGTTTTNEGSGLVVCHLNEASPNSPVWDEMTLSSSTSNTFDKKLPAKDNLSMAQEQTVEAVTKYISSSSSLLVPIHYGKQLIKPKPPPVAWSATSAQNKPPPVAQAATSAQNKPPLVALAVTSAQKNMMMKYPQHCHQVFIQEHKHLNYPLK